MAFRLCRLTTGVLPAARANAKLFSTAEARQLTWTIERTPSKQLPVYREYKQRGYRRLTRVRGFEGDAKALAEELEIVCGPTEINIRPGRIEIKGDHTRKIKMWFERLGF